MTKPVILLTRQAGLNEADAQTFSQAGFATVACPLLTLKYLPLEKETKKNIEVANWLLFTSQAPVAQILPLISNSCNIATIGKKTAQVVEKLGRQVAFISPKETKKDFVAAFAKANPDPGNIFYPKSQLANDYIETQLGKVAHVTSATTYLNLPDESGLEQCKKLLQDQAVAGVYLTSPSSAKRFLSLGETLASDFLYFAIGLTTKNYLAQKGIESQLISDLQSGIS